MAFVSACTTTGPSRVSPDINDPYEQANRSVHAFNLAVDRAIFRPASKGYVTIVPDPIVTSFSYFADNISEPGNMINAILQGDLPGAGTALGRFAMNSTIGFLGLADPATEFGLPPDPTDFGETLHVWGVGEGAYIELPFFGPSTQRDSVGLLVDFFTNPMGYARSQSIANASLGAEVVQRLGDRGRFSDTVDSILYESADSYAQSRVIYLQNRRFELAGSAEQDYADPYQDFADPYSDFSTDPYEDPYAE